MACKFTLETITGMEFPMRGASTRGAHGLVMYIRVHGLLSNPYMEAPHGLALIPTR